MKIHDKFCPCDWCDVTFRMPAGFLYALTAHVEFASGARRDITATQFDRNPVVATELFRSAITEQPWRLPDGWQIF